MPDTDTTRDATAWQPTACILCSINCGIEVRLDGRRFARIRGDKAHPASAGCTCEKALRLDHYQNDPHRLTTPLRRRPDGSFEAVDWDTAIAEVAARLTEVRTTHGGERIFYYGGGGQGNHLGGSYATALRRAAGVTYTSNALAQEKTGEFWVDGQLFGRPRCHTTPDLAHTEVAVFVGKNPWQSHGFPRARTVLKAIANDPGRAMVVIDPRRTETAALSDIHLQVRPGTDAWCLATLLAVLVEEDLVDRAFVADRTAGYGELAAVLRDVPIADHCARAGVDEADVRRAARRMAAAESVATLEDLGIQQAPHSTLSSYLEKLLYLLVGSFGKGGGMNIHTRFASLGGSVVASTGRPAPGADRSAATPRPPSPRRRQAGHDGRHHDRRPHRSETMSDPDPAASAAPVPPTGAEWLAGFAAALGSDPPDAATIEVLLDLAGVAAHASERIAAPIACYVAGRLGVDPAEALTVARGLEGSGRSGGAAASGSGGAATGGAGGAGR